MLARGLFRKRLVRLEGEMFPAKPSQARLLPLSPLSRVLSTETGTGVIQLPKQFSGRMFVPDHASVCRALPLLIVLHGAGGQDGGLSEIAVSWAISAGSLALMPNSAGTTWDILRGGYGNDLAGLDRLLQWAVQNYAVDLERVGVAGFRTAPVTHYPSDWETRSVS